MTLNIFILTWNTQSVRYNTKGNPTADFIADLVTRIGPDRDLVVIALQEDATRDSPLLDGESLIGHALASHYTMLDLVTLSGWGVTTYKALKDNWEYRPRGLRLALFAAKDNDLVVNSCESRSLLSLGYRDLITYGKGAAVINIDTNHGKIAFINMHLPFNSRTLIQNSETKSTRHAAVMWQAKCLQCMYQKVVDYYSPDHVFVCGDLNFRVQLRTEQSAVDVVDSLFANDKFLQELVEEADELRLLINYSIKNNVGFIAKLIEGVDNRGPRFFPTCKMNQKRDADSLNRESYLIGSKNHRTPSWCDRILYCSEKNNIKCLEYDRWEAGNMARSDHCAVVGTFSIGSDNG